MSRKFPASLSTKGKRKRYFYRLAAANLRLHKDVGGLVNNLRKSLGDNLSEEGLLQLEKELTSFADKLDAKGTLTKDDLPLRCTQCGAPTQYRGFSMLCIPCEDEERGFDDSD